jgi:hypothetical protein
MDGAGIADRRFRGVWRGTVTKTRFSPLLAAVSLIPRFTAQERAAGNGAVPTTWGPEAIATPEIPLANAVVSHNVPSLKGVWYRGMSPHDGGCATFDPRRLKGGYIPTGFVGPPGVKSRALKGHEFGLNLSTDDKGALIAFLRTL